MCDIEWYYLFFLSILGAFLMVLMFFINISNFTFDRSQKRRFNTIFSLVIFLCLWDMVSTILEKNATSVTIPLDFVINYFGFAILPVIPILLGNLIVSSNMKKVSSIGIGIYALILLILVSCKQVFHFEDGVYVRGVGFYAWYLPAVLLSFFYLTFYAVKLNIKNVSSHPVMLIFLVLALGFGMAAQSFAPGLHTTPISVSVATIFFYLYFTVYNSQIDGLTSLFSQYSFKQRIKNIKDGEIIFVMDVDNFKTINDTYGHAKGDEILKEMAKIINHIFGKSGRCFRTGGDEFSAICNKDIDVQDYISRFKNLVAARSEKLMTTASIGHCIYAEGVKPEDACIKADSDMYEDKARTKTIQMQKEKEEQN